MKPTPLPALASLVVLTLGAACRGPGEAEPRAEREREPFVPLPDEEPQTIGYFLTVFDRSLAQWTELKLGSATARDVNTREMLERNMLKRARERRDELVAELDGGPPVNRRIAAAALGFSHDPTVLGPLLAALADPDAEVVQRALLSLGVLALPETPLGEIRRHLLEDPDPWTRSNAAFALLGLARAGSAAPELAESCRAALADAEPGVRAQCASALGALADEPSASQLGELLYDEANLVALASALALARIGRERGSAKGNAARALAGGLERVSAERRAHLLGALRWLSGLELGEDARPWREWAAKLP